MRSRPARVEGLLARCFAALALFVLALAAWPAGTRAQTVTATPAWAIATDTQNAEAAGTDAAGNIYIYGQFSAATVTVGSITLTRVGSNTNLWVAKISADGTVQWAKNFGGTPNTVTSSYGMAVDPSGNVYFAGYFSTNSLIAGSTTLPLSTGSTRDGLLVKLTTDGSVAWAASFPAGNTGGGGLITINSVALDASNNPVVSGFYSGSTSTVIGGTTLTRIGSTDLLVAKLSTADGSVSWIKNFGGASATFGNPNIGVDPSGNVYTAGYFLGDSVAIGSTLSRIGTGANLFLAKLNSTGAPVWATNYGSAGASLSFNAATQLNGLDVDSSGNVYFVNAFNGGNLSIGGVNLTRVSTSSNDMVIAKVDTNGNTVWARNYGTSGSSSTIGMGIRVDTSGNVYASGYFNGATINIGGTILTRVGSTDGLVMRLSSAGNVVWA